MKNDLQLQHMSAILHGKDSHQDETFVLRPHRLVTAERLRPQWVKATRLEKRTFIHSGRDTSVEDTFDNGRRPEVDSRDQFKMFSFALPCIKVFSCRLFWTVPSPIKSLYRDPTIRNTQNV